MIVQDAYHSLLVALFPPRCLGCEQVQATDLPTLLCTPCRTNLEVHDGPQCATCGEPGEAYTCRGCTTSPPAFEQVWCPFIYAEPLTRLIVAAKFEGREDAAVALGRLLLAHQNHAPVADVIVPIPLGYRRGRTRGYNQAAIMARTLANAWGVDVRHALRRTRDTEAQSGLPAAARHPNLRGAFTPRQRLCGTVMLVDDVVTSGETIRAAAAALRQAGARRVVVAAAARAALGRSA